MSRFGRRTVIVYGFAAQVICCFAIALSYYFLNHKLSLDEKNIGER